MNCLKEKHIDISCHILKEHVQESWRELLKIHWWGIELTISYQKLEELKSKLTTKIIKEIIISSASLRLLTLLIKNRKKETWTLF